MTKGLVFQFGDVDVNDSLNERYSHIQNQLETDYVVIQRIQKPSREAIAWFSGNLYDIHLTLDGAAVAKQNEEERAVLPMYVRRNEEYMWMDTPSSNMVMCITQVGGRKRQRGFEFNHERDNKPLLYLPTTPSLGIKLTAFRIPPRRFGRLGAKGVTCVIWNGLRVVNCVSITLGWGMRAKSVIQDEWHPNIGVLPTTGWTINKS